MMMSPVMTMNPMTTKHAAEEASAACTGTYQTEVRSGSRERFRFLVDTII